MQVYVIDVEKHLDRVSLFILVFTRVSVVSVRVDMLWTSSNERRHLMTD